MTVQKTSAKDVRSPLRIGADLAKQAAQRLARIHVARDKHVGVAVLLLQLQRQRGGQVGHVKAKVLNVARKHIARLRLSVVQHDHVGVRVVVGLGVAQLRHERVGRVEEGVHTNVIDADAGVGHGDHVAAKAERLPLIVRLVGLLVDLGHVPAGRRRGDASQECHHKHTR